MNTQLTEIELKWNGEKFVCEDKKVENLIYFKSRFCLLQNKRLVVEFLQRCDFQLIGYEYSDRAFIIQKTEEVFMDIADEGTGFNIVFNLAAIALLDVKTSYSKNKKTGKFDRQTYLFEDHKNVSRIYINSESIKSSLHPLLFKRVKNLGVQLQCKFLSPKDMQQYLKCAVNPLGDCGTCQHFEAVISEIVCFR